MSSEYKVIPMADMAKAMLDGHTLEFPSGAVSRWNGKTPIKFMFADGCEVDCAWAAPCRIIPNPTTPTTRYMTRDEVIGFIANTPGIGVRCRGSSAWQVAGFFGYGQDVDHYEYTTVTLDGVYGEPMEFRKDVVG